jgi:hypothetical protein
MRSHAVCQLYRVCKKYVVGNGVTGRTKYSLWFVTVIILCSLYH